MAVGLINQQSLTLSKCCSNGIFTCRFPPRQYTSRATQNPSSALLNNNCLRWQNSSQRQPETNRMIYPMYVIKIRDASQPSGKLQYTLPMGKAVVCYAAAPPWLTLPVELCDRQGGGTGNLAAGGPWHRYIQRATELILTTDSSECHGVRGRA